MRKLTGPIVLAAVVGGIVCGVYLFNGQEPAGAQASVPVPLPIPNEPGPPVYKLEDAYLEWPVPAGEEVYASIDGKHLHRYVQEITAISRRYRDQGHQLWGRLEGTASDEESARWMADRLKAAGAEVRLQSFDLPPQWLPRSWEVSTTAGDKPIVFTTAQPSTRTVGTEGRILDLEVVYVGLGNEGDFKGRDVRGKAVLIYAMPQPGAWGNSANYNGAATRAQQLGASAVFVVIALPGNIRTQYSIFRGIPGQPAEATAKLTPVPGFTMGLEDGELMRRLIDQAPAGRPLRLKVSLDVQMVPGLTSPNVWGVLPGMTDEKIMIVAHRDGWFEGAGDNASGMATTVGLAEYFAKIPKEKRRRTLEFVGTPGHHGTQVGVQWMADNKDTVLNKTALIINAEHTALTQQYLFAGRLRASNTTTALHWAFNGSRRLIDTAINAFDKFGVATYVGTDRVAMAEISRVSQLAPSFGVIDVDTYYHSDHETADVIPWTGLASVTRAFAKIIDDVNKIDLKDLQPPPAPSN